MPYNALAFSLAPANWFAPFPTVLEQSAAFTTAQMAANSSYTAVSGIVSTANSLVEAAKKRTTGMTIIVPTDQQAVAISNLSTLAGPFAGALYGMGSPIFGQTLVNIANGGFILPPGNSLFLSPFNDALYAIAVGPTTTIYFADS